MRERISFSLPFFPWGYRTTETLCVLLHQRRNRFPPPRLQKRTPPPSYFFPSELCSIATSPLFFLGSHAYTYAERRPTPTSSFLPYTSPFSFAFFPPLSLPTELRVSTHTYTDGGGGGLTHADTRTGERAAKEAEVGGGWRRWKKGAKGRRRLICPTSNSKKAYFFRNC